MPAGATFHLDAEGRFVDYTTRGLVDYTVEVLREGDVILGDGDQDYAAANLLEILGALHDQTGLNVEQLPQIRGFCILMLEQAGWSE